MSKKKFDAVKMMRDIRNKLQTEYEKNAELREKRLKKIRKKYKIKKKKVVYSSQPKTSIAAEPKAKYKKAK